MQPWTDTGLREAILDAARTLLVGEGYERLSMRKISGAVGCSVSSIYLYFENKDQLVHALIDEGFHRWNETVSALADEGMAPPQRLELHCRQYIRFGLDNPEFYEIMYLFHPRRMERVPRELFRRASRSMDSLSEIVRECAPERFRHDADARVHAHVIWAIVHGVVSTILASRVSTRVDQGAYIETSIQCALATVSPVLPART